MATIFSTIESVLGVNKELLESLEERLAHWGPNSLIGDVMVKLAPYMKIYTQVNHHSDCWISNQFVVCELV